MGLPMDFDDRQDHIDAQNEEYHPYQYQEDENNKSWAGALPVKQYGAPMKCRNPTGIMYG